ncbi:unnamed protein product [Arctia plantaginis]|uniref:Uncharacterized protein n=1 Tax=Arctia plantaginis TaxID=874455 RepID=A0A8S1AGH6_ARCPL|nr:unnamed protein product [Arctia plantaginis]CAB3245394.1 unnamed protein product [Arctia plantaginis]
MKYLFVFALLIGSISATELAPEQASVEPRFIDVLIRGVLEDAMQGMRDRGLDPLLIHREAGKFALPVPELFTAVGYVENLSVIGLSNINIKDINFSITRLRIELELPGIEIAIGRAYGKVSGFGDSAEGLISGRVSIKSLRVAADAHLSLIGGISLNSLVVDASLGGIDSGFTTVQLLHLDLTDRLNHLLGTLIPDLLEQNREDLNETISAILLIIINNLLDGLTFFRNLA